ncbi:hypothetical protein HY633_03005, partial [Candidatus Uhrbacteria bacterium]|nr:hypothetical protein [Candidatus Uhrbacteria bacterium]
MDDTCWLCGFFNQLHGIGTTFIERIYVNLGQPASVLFGTALAAYLSWFGLTMVLGQRSIDDVKKLVGVCLAAAVAIVMLGDYTIYRDWIFRPLEDTALDLGMAVIEIVGTVSDADIRGPTGSEAANKYAVLIGAVEKQIVAIVKFTWQLVSGGPGSDQTDSGFFGNISAAVAGAATFIPRLVGAVIILIPYLFVLGVFVAFLVEALFKFVAMGIVAPLLVMAFPFPATRAFPLAAARILLGAALTIVFAAGAMGLTVSTVDTYRKSVTESWKGEAAWKANCQTVNPKPGDPLFGQCQGDFKGKAFSLGSQEFVLFFVIGFVSILLHLQAKALASNLSGANDGAGPAAATVAAGQAIFGAGLAASNRAMFGRGGISTSAQAALSGSGAGSVAEHGLVGGPIAAA